MPKRKQFTKLQRQYIYNKFRGHCAYCGCELKHKSNMQVDHVVPLARGGSDDIDNAFPACRSCNHYKSTYTVEGFREQAEKWHDRLMRDSVTYKNAVRFGLVIPNPRKVEFYFEKIERGV